MKTTFRDRFKSGSKLEQRFKLKKNIRNGSILTPYVKDHFFVCLSLYFYDAIYDYKVESTLETVLMFEFLTLTFVLVMVIYVILCMHVFLKIDYFEKK